MDFDYFSAVSLIILAHFTIFSHSFFFLQKVIFSLSLFAKNLIFFSKSFFVNFLFLFLSFFFIKENFSKSRKSGQASIFFFFFAKKKSYEDF